MTIKYDGDAQRYAFEVFEVAFSESSTVYNIQSQFQLSSNQFRLNICYSILSVSIKL